MNTDRWIWIVGLGSTSGTEILGVFDSEAKALNKVKKSLSDYGLNIDKYPKQNVWKRSPTRTDWTGLWGNWLFMEKFELL